MKKLSLFIALSSLILAACSSEPPPAPEPLTTGIIGQAFIHPFSICSPDLPCEVPLESGFQLMQDTVILATFQTDQDGKFRLELLPGEYIIAYHGAVAENPYRPVTVPADSMVTVRLVWTNFP